MRVFLSWSGEQSHQVAIALREWLPNVVQALDPWVSSSDIEKGESWFSAISDSLVAAGGMGIFCLTPTNLNAPWLAYEAGALASHDRGRVATFLYGISPSEVKPPLGLFQGTDSASRSDVLRLLTTVNSRLAAPLSEARLQNAFDTHWDALVEQLKGIPAAPADKKKHDVDPTPLLNEILAVVRRIEKDAAGKQGPDSSSSTATWHAWPNRPLPSDGLLALSPEQIEALAEETKIRGTNRLMDILNARERAYDELHAPTPRFAGGGPGLSNTPSPPPPVPPPSSSPPQPIARSSPPPRRGPKR